MATKTSTFLQSAAIEYQNKCPELARFLMTKCYKRFNDHVSEEIDKNMHSIACEHCGNIFSGTNCVFRIKPKRKRRKKIRYRNSQNIRKSCNFLQILCKYCGWKTRCEGAAKKRRQSSTDSNSAFRTPECNRSMRELDGSSSRQRYSSGSKKRCKSRLKEILEKERLDLDKNKTPPSLRNFLATI